MALRVIACGLSALLLAAPAEAGSIVVRLGLRPGGLTVHAGRTPLAAGATAAIHVRVADGRGSGRGWSLRLAGDPDVTVTRVTATCAPHSTCTLPAAAAALPGTVLRAARGTGMGAIDLVVTVHARAATTVRFALR